MTCDQFALSDTTCSQTMIGTGTYTVNEQNCVSYPTFGVYYAIYLTTSPDFGRSVCPLSFCPFCSWPFSVLPASFGIFVHIHCFCFLCMLLVFAESPMCHPCYNVACDTPTDLQCQTSPGTCDESTGVAVCNYPAVAVGTSCITSDMNPGQCNGNGQCAGQFFMLLHTCHIFSVCLFVRVLVCYLVLLSMFSAISMLSHVMGCLGVTKTNCYNDLFYFMQAFQRCGISR